MIISLKQLSADRRFRGGSAAPHPLRPILLVCQRYEASSRFLGRWEANFSSEEECLADAGKLCMSRYPIHDCLNKRGGSTSADWRSRLWGSTRSHVLDRHPRSSFTLLQIDLVGYAEGTCVFVASICRRERMGAIAQELVGSSVDQTQNLVVLYFHSSLGLVLTWKDGTWNYTPM